MLRLDLPCVRARRFCLVLCVALLCAGCTLLKLDHQLRVFESARYFTGVVQAEGSAEAPIVVVLYATQPEPRAIALDRVPRSPSVYRMAALDGRYSILAFGDTNRNFRYDAGEPATIVSDAQALQMSDANPEPTAGEDLALIQIPAAAPPGFEAPAIFGKSYDALLRQKQQALGGLLTNNGGLQGQGQHVRQGLFEPLTFLGEGRSGLFLLEAYDPQRTPVIFVHGLHGSPSDWASIIAALDRSRFQAWVFYYPTALPIGLQTLMFDNALQAVHERYGFSRSAIVAHSVGGLISRGALSLADHEGRPAPVQQLVTLSTPWLGHEGGRWASLGITRMPMSWRDMAPGSDFMKAALSVEVPPCVVHTLLFGVGGRAWYPFGNNDGSVTLGSMLAIETQRRADHVFGFDESHGSILTSPDVIRQINQRLGAAGAASQGESRRAANCVP